MGFYLLLMQDFEGVCKGLRLVMDKTPGGHLRFSIPTHGKLESVFMFQLLHNLEFDTM